MSNGEVHRAIRESEIGREDCDALIVIGEIGELFAGDERRD
jgi:hypothetical protein